ncbi:MAG: C40 family peptidase, partial [Actinomycetota bacterium]|nr:C40 family peptidase [Actinomycetota bacterium]
GGSGSGGSGSGGSGSGGSDGGGSGGGGDTATKPRLPAAIPPQPGDGVDVNLPDGSTVAAPNEIAAAAVRNALSNLGVPYVWGGTTPGEALDCSGLTMTSYAAAGLEIPRHSAGQAIGAEVPSAAELLPGDLVVWDGHVAMCIGNGQIVEAGDPVQVGDVRTTNSGMPFLGFYRPTG